MQIIIYSRITAFVIIFAIFSICRGDDIQDLYVKYISAIGSTDYPQNADMSWVTPELTQSLIIEAKSNLHNSDPLKGGMANMALIELGDPSTIESYMADYHHGKLSVMPSIQLLPYLIDDLYHGSTQIDAMAPNSDVTAGPSLMDNSTVTMYKIVALYPSFRPEIRAWAKREMATGFSNEGPNSEANQLMRMWWEHNKEAVLTHEYGKVNWLPTPDQEAAEHAKDKPLAKPVAKAVGKVAPPDSPKTIPPNSIYKGWGIEWQIVIALVALAIGFFIVRLLTKK
jgi:hypothetical protein